jgi:translation initiation factor IF-1
MKIIGAVLAVLLLIFIPIVTAVEKNDIGIERTAWNCVQNYTDIIADKGRITSEDYERFMLKLGATGIAWRVTVTVDSRRVYAGSVLGQMEVRHVTTHVFKSETGGIFNTNVRLRKGDIVTVSIVSLNKTSGQQLAENILNIWTAPSEISLAAMVRNDG